LFVNGEGMRGGAVHHTIGEHPFIGYARTAPKYRFFSVDISDRGGWRAYRFQPAAVDG
jgi:hypothetical protein